MKHNYIGMYNFSAKNIVIHTSILHKFFYNEMMLEKTVIPALLLPENERLSCFYDALH